MPEFDWRAPESYKRVQDADITAIAWEYLRRNPDYRRDYQEMVKGAIIVGVVVLDQWRQRCSAARL